MTDRLRDTGDPWPRGTGKAWHGKVLAAGAGLFSSWLFDVAPDWSWNWAHLRYVRRHLARLAPGDNLMIFLPPRHGKSEMLTVRYAAWYLETYPDRRVIVGAYNQTLANKFSRKTRAVARTRIPLDKERTAVEDWQTTHGGGLRAVGVGAGITGQGGDLIIIDDPVKSREEANSATYRDRVYDWYTDDLYTRREPGASMILIMTRWHEDDLAGRILASDDAGSWRVLTLPALAEPDDPLGRPVGAALCPERYDEAALADIRTAIGSRSFASLYQQRPVELEGGFFKASWFLTAPAPASGVTWVRYWDRAGTAGKGDYTVGVRMGRSPDGLFYIDDVVRGQWSTGERDRIVRATAARDGTAVPVILEQEPGSSGVDAFSYMARQLAGYAVHADRVTGDKETRARGFAAQLEAGNVYLRPGADWLARYRAELCSFPSGTHDDQVDASSGAFNYLHALSGGFILW